MIYDTNQNDRKLTLRPIQIGLNPISFSLYSKLLTLIISVYLICN